MSALTENKQEREIALKHIFNTMRKEDMQYVRPEVKTLVKVSGQRISWRKYQTLRLNSYERDFLLEHLSNECIIRLTEHAVRNCEYDTSKRSYNEALMGLYTPLILKRFKEIVDAKNGVRRKIVLRVGT